MDNPTFEIEGVHGQLMALEHYADTSLHVWHDCLHAHAFSFPGTSV